MKEEKEKILFIMGNGPSLTALADEEKNIIRENDSLAMNAYLLHADKIGIVPTYYLLEDGGETTFESLKKIPGIIKKKEFAKIELWLSKAWFNKFEDCKNRRTLITHTHWYLGDVKFSFNLFKLSAYKNNFELIYDYLARVLTGSLLSTRKVKRFWAYNLNEPLLHYRGTLTAAINLGWILGYKKIHLVGVDLNNGKHFYKNDPKLVERDSKAFGIDARKSHATAVYYGKHPPIQVALTKIFEFLKKGGCELYVANPESLLVRENFLPFKKITS